MQMIWDGGGVLGKKAKICSGFEQLWRHAAENAAETLKLRTSGRKVAWSARGSRLLRENWQVFCHIAPIFRGLELT